MPPHQHEQQRHHDDGAQNECNIMMDYGNFPSYSSSELQETAATTRESSSWENTSTGMLTAKRRRSTTPCTPTSVADVVAVATTTDGSSNSSGSSSRKRSRQTCAISYQKEQQQECRTVTFGAAETTMIQHIPNARDELSKQERRTVYLSRGELRRTRNEILKTLRHYKDMMLHCHKNNNTDDSDNQGTGADSGLPPLSDHETSDSSNASNSESSDDEKKQTATDSQTTTTTTTTTTTDYCLRGLETYLPIVKQERVQRVAGALQAILMEQQHQRRTSDIAGVATTTTDNRHPATTTTGTLNPQWIHSVYLPLTAESKKLALLAGFYDEDAANDS